MLASQGRVNSYLILKDDQQCIYIERLVINDQDFTGGMLVDGALLVEVALNLLKVSVLMLSLGVLVIIHSLQNLILFGIVIVHF